MLAFFILPVGGKSNCWWPCWTRTYPSSWHLPVQLPSLLSTICMTFSAQQKDIWQHREQSHSENSMVAFHQEQKNEKKGDEKKKHSHVQVVLIQHEGTSPSVERFLAFFWLSLVLSSKSSTASCPLFVRGAVLKSECMFSMSLKHNSVNVQPELQILERGYPSHDQNMISKIINDSHAFKATDSPWGKKGGSQDKKQGLIPPLSEI